MKDFLIDVENGVLSVGEHEFEIYEVEIKGKKTVYCETDLKSISDFNLFLSEFPENLNIQISNDTGFGTYLFYAVSITKHKSSFLFDFECNQPNKHWEGNWGLSTFLATLSETVKTSNLAKVDWLDLDNDWKELNIHFNVIDEAFDIKTKVEELSDILKKLIKQTELALSGAVWRKEYETNESLYCTDILYPLLRKMGYLDVRYTHGTKEYGKDFTFSEQTKFGNLRHFGLQAKAGNLRGNVNAEIDEIIGQLNDAFSMSYHEISANETRQISTFIVAISGQYTDNAKDKIIQKIPKHFLGSVYFIDRDKTIELIERYWK